MNSPKRRVTSVLLLVGLIATGTLLRDGDSVMPPAATQANNLPVAAATLPEAAKSLAVERLAVPDSRPARGYYTALAGSQFLFRVTAKQASQVQLTADQDPSSFDLLTEADMQLTIADRRDHEMLVAVKFPKWCIQVGQDVPEGAAMDDMCAHMASGAIVRMHDDGSVVGWRFPASTPASMRSMTKGLFALSRFVTADPAESQWQTEEVDPSGTYVVDYHRVPALGKYWKVRRNRHHLRPIGDGADAKTQVRDTSVATFDPSLGWLIAATSRESIDMAFTKHEMTVAASAEMSLRLLGSGVASQLPTVQWGGHWDDVDTAKEMVVGQQAEQRERDEKLVASAPMSELLFDIPRILDAHSIRSKELWGARERVKAALRLHPDNLERVRQLVATGSLGEAGTGVALSAVGSVGSEQGQLFLAETMRNRSAATSVRGQAMFALFQVADPLPTVHEETVKIWQDPSMDYALRNTALLLLGSHARASDDYFEELLQLAPSSNAGFYLQTFMESLGNAERFDTVATYLEHPDVGVRQAAKRVMLRRP